MDPTDDNAHDEHGGLHSEGGQDKDSTHKAVEKIDEAPSHASYGFDKLSKGLYRTTLETTTMMAILTCKSHWVLWNLEEMNRPMSLEETCRPPRQRRTILHSLL
jgi:hypothetical protein